MKSPTNRGQSKVHEILNADGTPAFNPDGTPLTMTQEEWRNRDKSLGYTRAEDEVAEEAPVDDGTSVEGEAPAPAAQG